jgi:hypothetical protein
LTANLHCPGDIKNQKYEIIKYKIKDKSKKTKVEKEWKTGRLGDFLCELCEGTENHRKKLIIK